MIRSLRRLKRWAQSYTPQAIILLYHRVADLPSDPEWLGVPARLFAEHLEILRRKNHPLSLSDLCERMRQGNIPRNAVVITFDDGYADNLHSARPLLTQFDVPATTFVVAGQVGKTEEFWWDELARILLATPVLPALLQLTIAGKEFTWHLDEVHNSVRVHHWNVLMKTDHPCQIAYREITPLLRDMESLMREGYLAELREWAGVSRIGREDYRSLNCEELKLLACDGLVEIGAHSMTHPVLSSLSHPAQFAEISNSKILLEQAIGRSVVSYSYPYGGRKHYTSETIQMVQEAGFARACSNFPGHIRRNTDLYKLPRYLVRDWNGDEFARKLEQWFSG